MITQERIQELIGEHSPEHGHYLVVYQESTSDLEPDNYLGYLKGSIEDLQASLDALIALKDAIVAEDKE